MDAGNRQMRVAELGEQRARALEAEPRRARRTAEQVLERALVGGADVAQGETQPEAAGLPIRMVMMSVAPLSSASWYFAWRSARVDPCGGGFL